MNFVLWAMAQRPTLWVGEEAAHAKLREAIAPELHGRLLLRGWTADMRPLYLAMGVLAVEAQACGIPVLASRIGGLPVAALRRGRLV